MTKMKLCQIEPTDDMYGGLARAIVMGRDMGCNKAHLMIRHLERGGNIIPDWLDEELNGEKHLAKGDMAAIIYKAMTAEYPTVEVVDVENMEDFDVVHGCELLCFNDELHDYLSQNGYKIIKEVKDA